MEEYLLGLTSLMLRYLSTSKVFFIGHMALKQLLLEIIRISQVSSILILYFFVYSGAEAGSLNSLSISPNLCECLRICPDFSKFFRIFSETELAIGERRAEPRRESPE